MLHTIFNELSFCQIYCISYLSYLLIQVGFKDVQFSKIIKRLNSHTFLTNFEICIKSLKITLIMHNDTSTNEFSSYFHTVLWKLVKTFLGVFVVTWFKNLPISRGKNSTLTIKMLIPTQGHHKLYKLDKVEPFIQLSSNMRGSKEY